MSKLHIKDLEPIDTEILVDTPAAGDQRIYKAYSIFGDLNRCAIIRTDILDNNPGAGDQTIQERYACTTAAAEDRLDFNKIWANRATYTYKPVLF